MRKKSRDSDDQELWESAVARPTPRFRGYVKVNAEARPPTSDAPPEEPPSEGPPSQVEPEPATSRWRKWAPRKSIG